MFFGIDLNQILLFPIKDQEARKYFLIGCVIALLAFIIPILPYLVLFGYGARIARQIFNHEAPHMTAWDDIGGLFKDGLLMFGIRFIYSLPIVILALPVMIMGFAMPFLAENMNNNPDAFLAVFMLIMFGSMCIIVPLSLPLAVIIPAAEMHTLDKNEFSAGFRIREWWAIFRPNLGGFIAAFAVYYLATMILAIVMQILMATIILSCLLPIFMPAMTLYSTLIMYACIAQAYRDGKMKVIQA